ncbi:MAG: tetratricopeptide repeat protein, partial [Verrucomicrobiota bacterium]
EGAEALYRRALAGREKALGAEHPDTLKSAYELGLTLLRRRKCAEAEPLLLCEFTATKASDGEFSDPAKGSALTYAMCLKRLGRLDEATNLLRSYLDSNRGYFRYNLACYECLCGNVEQSKRLIAEEVAAKPAAREEALKDDDLKAIWDFIRNLAENKAK